MGKEGGGGTRAEELFKARLGTRGTLGPVKPVEGGGEEDVGRATQEGDRVE